MGKRGPAPAPTELKLLRGNPGKRPLNDKEPRPAEIQETPKPPAFLGKYGKKEWKRITPLLVKNKLFTELDETALAAYCQAYDRWITVEKCLRGYEKMTYVTDKGNIVQRPEVGIANKAMEELLKFGREFGLSPSSRTNLKVEEQETKDDPFLGLMKGINNAR